MSGALIVVIVVLFSLLLVGAPVIFAIGSAALAYFIIKPGMWSLISVYAHNFFTGMDIFVFLCIPLFLIAGEIMGTIGMTESLMKFAQLIVGRFRGGLAYVNVLGSMFFGGVSGSALADVSALGPIEIDMMKRDGYSPEFSTALTVTSAIQGPIIPPSIPMIIFASLTNVSVGAMFLGGVIPGIMIGLGQMAIIKSMAVRRHFPAHRIEDLNLRVALRIILDASWSLAMALIIIVGITSGVFTATEAAAVAAGYATFVGFFIYKKLNLKEFWHILGRVARTSASIYLIIAFAGVISWVIAAERAPDLVANFVHHHNFNRWSLFLLLNGFFLFNGCWISDIVQLLLFAPLFTPIMESLGVHPIHFGVVMVVNVMISLITPPYGTALYLGAIVGRVPLSAIVRQAIPFLLSSIIILCLITYVPILVLWFPSLFGLVK
jgi:tripartite ATP-independent transporter DctM subunit